ncbi:hypothetical protein [Clostridium sp. C8-1-8]|uniref:hypothetical protein n=1 Tax=Clostridium sp. C8-1-8 TaxID=2698831 RepID=UPI0013697DFA|nr:hypothetical protein [Clostridium sp. C8-1-8]
MATPLSIQTTSSFASLTGTTPIPVPVPLLPGTGTETPIGSIILPLSNRSGRVFIEGTIPVVLSALAAAAAITGTLDVVLSVYRSATATTPIYTIRQTLLPATALAALAAPIFDILPFQFVDAPAVPLCADTSSYFFRVTAITTGITITAATLTVNSTITTPGEFFNIIAEEVPGPVLGTTTTTTTTITTPIVTTP